MIIKTFNGIDILHLQFNNTIFYFCMMQPVNGLESTFVFYNTELLGKSHQTTSAITTHGTFVSVGIVIHHFKIVIVVVFQKDKSVGTYAKTSVAQPIDLFGIIFVECLLTIINHHKIVSRSLIFIKSLLHNNAQRYEYYRVLLTVKSPLNATLKIVKSRTAIQ